MGFCQKQSTPPEGGVLHVAQFPANGLSFWGIRLGVMAQLITVVKKTRLALSFSP